MPIKATPSRDYPFVLVPEDQQAFRNPRSAIRALKKQWAGQDPANRNSYFIAQVVRYVEADYDVDAHDEPIDGGNGEDGEGLLTP
jgi:hypothetical protein